MRSKALRSRASSTASSCRITVASVRPASRSSRVSADADHRRQSGRERERRLPGDRGIVLTVQRAPLGVADQHEGAARVGEHARRHLAGVRTVVPGARTVLAAEKDRNAGDRRTRVREVNEGRTYTDVDPRQPARPLAHPGDERPRVLAGAVHLPVSGNERTTHPVSPATTARVPAGSLGKKTRKGNGRGMQDQ